MRGVCSTHAGGFCPGDLYRDLWRTLNSLSDVKIRIVGHHPAIEPVCKRHSILRNRTRPHIVSLEFADRCFLKNIVEPYFTADYRFIETMECPFLTFGSVKDVSITKIGSMIYNKRIDR